MGFNLPSTVYLPPELDKKATNLHTRMALYFDNFIYREPSQRNDTLLYMYMYFIIDMLAKEAGYFRSYKEYDDFANYMATKLYLRYINPEHTKKHGRIKSVLNYCKSLLYPSKVDFQRETFNEIIGTANDGTHDGLGEAVREDMANSIQETHYREVNLVDVILNVIDDVPEVIHKVVKEAHYKEGTELYHRLCISTLMSALNGVTFSNATLEKLQDKESTAENDKINDKIKFDLYKKESNDCVILWRLEDKYKSLVQLLLTKTKIRFAEAVMCAKGDVELNADEITAIIMSAYGNTLRDDNEEF